jgi:hypothetical protein
MKLKATITWSFVDGTLRSDRILTDIGDKVENGKITIADVKVEDRGRYSCTAVWYSGQATFKQATKVISFVPTQLTILCKGQSMSLGESPDSCLILYSFHTL